MISLDTRSRDILINLLQSDEPVATREIADDLKITPRAVNYSIQGTELWLNSRGIQIQKTPGVGLFLDVGKDIKKDLVSELKSLSGYSLVLSPQERQRFLTLSLLTNKEPTLSKIAARTLGVSRPTIFSDLDKVEEWLLEHEIKLIRQPGTGFRVEGREINFRNAIEEVLVETIGMISLIALCKGEHNSFLSRFDTGVSSVLPLPFVNDSIGLRFCGRLVEKIEEMQDYFFSDSSHISLALFLLILINRNLDGYHLGHYSTNLGDEKKSKEFSIAEKIISKINLRFDIRLPKDEIINITIRIMGLKSRQSLSATNLVPDLKISNDEFEEVIFNMVQEASKMLHPILCIDQKLIRGLMIHLKPAINRLSFNLPIRNILLPEIRKKYPYIYMVAQESVGVLEDKFGIQVTDAEIGFIAMHLGAAMERLRTVRTEKLRALVVCGGGCATAYMLVSRIQAEFPEIHVVEVSSMLELTKEVILSSNPDLIISTVPLKNIPIPTLIVNPLLNDEDRTAVSQYIEKLDSSTVSTNNQEQLSGFTVMSLLNEGTVQPGVKAEGWQDAVLKACMPLVENNAIELKYVDGIKDLLLKHGPYMVLSREVVLLHAMIGYGVNRLCMGLTTFSPPVRFNHEQNDPVSVAIVFGMVDSRSHLKALSQLSSLLGDRELIQSIKNSKTNKKILKLVDTAIKKSTRFSMIKP